MTEKLIQCVASASGGGFVSTKTGAGMRKSLVQELLGISDENEQLGLSQAQKEIDKLIREAATSIEFPKISAKQLTSASSSEMTKKLLGFSDK